MSSIVSFFRWVTEHNASGWSVAAALACYLLYYVVSRTIRDNTQDHDAIRKDVGELNKRTSDSLIRISFLEGFQKGRSTAATWRAQ